MNGKSISVKQAAEIMGKNPQFIRLGLQSGRVPIESAVKRKTKWNYYISPELFRQYTGVDINMID